MKRHLAVRAGLASGLLMAASLLDAGAAAAGPSVTSAEDNVAYAVSAICAPFVLDQQDRESLPLNQPLVHSDGYDALSRPNPQAVRVGFAGFVHATLATHPDGTRACDIGAKDADPQSLRAAALGALAARPERFAPTRSKYLPGRFATEDMLCASTESARPGAFVLLSATHPEERGRISILLTLANPATRMASCDHEGVRLNYRTLAQP